MTMYHDDEGTGIRTFTFETFEILIEDAALAEQSLDANPENQFVRRTYIRTFFSWAESMVWYYKELCLRAIDDNGKPYEFCPAEFLMLKEEDIYLNDLGECITRNQKINLVSNIFFTFKMYCKIYQRELDLSNTSEGYQAFKKAIRVRNDLMHPRGLDKLDVSNEDIEDCKKAMAWFLGLAKTAISFKIRY